MTSCQGPRYSWIQTNGMADVTILGSWRNWRQNLLFRFCTAVYGGFRPHLSLTNIPFLRNKQNGNQLYQMIVTSRKYEESFW